MDFKKILFYIILIGLFCQCKTQQFKEGSSRNGKCYAKCLIPDQVITETEEYVVYTGDEKVEDVEVMYKEIIVQPASTKWVKKLADRSCLSADPNDCMVWCLVEVEQIARTVKILVDSTQSSNYIIEKEEREIKKIKGGYLEWKEVICDDDLIPSLVTQIQSRLIEKRYFGGDTSGKMDLLTKESLIQFQNDNVLPVGQLDFETLDVLGIRY